MADLRTAMQIIATYLPSARAAAIQRTARRETALALVRRARRRLGHGQRELPSTAIAEAFAFDRSPVLVGRVILLLAHWFAESVKKAVTRAR
jgi:hypothetical protein